MKPIEELYYKHDGVHAIMARLLEYAEDEDEWYDISLVEGRILRVNVLIQTMVSAWISDPAGLEDTRIRDVLATFISLSARTDKTYTRYAERWDALCDLVEVTGKMSRLVPPVSRRQRDMLQILADGPATVRLLAVAVVDGVTVLDQLLAAGMVAMVRVSRRSKQPRRVEITDIGRTALQSSDVSDRK